MILDEIGLHIVVYREIDTPEQRHCNESRSNAYNDDDDDNDDGDDVDDEDDDNNDLMTINYVDDGNW